MNAFEMSIIAPAFLASLLVLSTHVPLGTEVLRRGIIFIDLAIAQVAGLGVIAAGTMGRDAQGWMVQIAAVSAALLAALILHWTDKFWPDIQEALIGHGFRAGRDRKYLDTRGQSAWGRAPERIVGRPDIVGQLRSIIACWHCQCSRSARLVLDA